VICPKCLGQRVVPLRVGKAISGYDICKECGGFGIVYCCEGEKECQSKGYISHLYLGEVDFVLRFDCDGTDHREERVSEKTDQDVTHEALMVIRAARLMLIPFRGAMETMYRYDRWDGRAQVEAALNFLASTDPR
jgi:hypothetical protein